MKVKVCGITNYQDASLSLDLGADALGFNFFPPSPRFIDPESTRCLIRRLPPFAISVGVFVNVRDPAEVTGIARHAGIQILQLHGDESPEYCRRLEGWSLIKALHIGKEPLDADFSKYPVRAFLLDAAHEALFGGTGRTFDWSPGIRNEPARPLILAGGLNFDNVAEAVRRIRPYAVDVCSGVEYEPGRKDPRKLGAFISAARTVLNKELGSRDE